KGRMMEAMAKGLSRQTHAQASVHMLPTYVCSTPDGTEKGDFLVVELRRRQVRTLWVSLPGDGNQNLPLKDQLFDTPEDIMQGSGEALFDFIAQCLGQFLDSVGLSSPQQHLPLGFVFPFSCRQTLLDQASGAAPAPLGAPWLIAWSKGVHCSDVEGHDVVQMLQAAINKQQRYHVDVVALMNDTVGTMMSCSVEGMPCEVGLVIDVGTNSCFMAEGCLVEMAEETSGRMCVNTEWGCFGDDGALNDVLTRYDESVDQESCRPGHKRFEKLIGGLYLGEIVRHVLAKLAAEGALFSGAAAPALATKDVLKTQQVLEIIDDEAGLAAARSALQALGLAPSEQDCCHVQQLCRAVVTRAAGLCAAGLAAILSYMCQSRELERLKVNVAVDGTVYRGHARFGEVLQRITKLLAPECVATLVPSVDGSGRGAAVVTAVALRLVAQRREMDQLLAPLRLGLADLQRVQALMRREMELGLKPETNAQSSVRMLPTYVRNTPDGTGAARNEGAGWRVPLQPPDAPCPLPPAERGDFLALDLGGTNFRVLVVHVEHNGVRMASQIYAIPLAIMQGTGEALFDHIIDCIIDFQQKQGMTGQVLPLGFTFSFPCHQLGLDKAMLLSWTKGFSASGCVGRDVVQMLREAAQRKQHAGLDVVAVVNDTVGTMMSCGYDDPSCEIGLIVGTGTNACYMEEMKNVGTVDGEEGRMCINMEWGAFGENGCLDDIFTDFDRMVDEKTINPGKQRWARVPRGAAPRAGAACAPLRPPARRFEKLISGMYLGEIVRYILLALVEKHILFRGKPAPKLQTRDIFQTKFLSTIEIGAQAGGADGLHRARSDGLALRQVRGVLHELELEASFEDSVLVREVCQTVSLRAAQLCAAGLAAVVEKMRESRGLAQLAVTVGVDGTLYKMHPRFSQHLQRTLRELAPKCSVTFLQSEDGSGKGAALVAAVHCRVAQAQGPQ
ncbi:HXK3 protein, partial [Nothoprocta pentlandii]|nr:HXK3 protein [Nothoprocta pentlandii]